MLKSPFGVKNINLFRNGLLDVRALPGTRDWLAAAVLFVTVEKSEPNRLYAYLFMFLIIALGTLAILNQMVP